MINGEHGLPGLVTAEHSEVERRQAEALSMKKEAKNACHPELVEGCYVCGGELKERRLKKHCTVCGTLCETCCDNGME